MLRSCSVDFVKWSSQGMLRMSPDAMNALFKPTIDSIIEHLRKYQPGLGHSVRQNRERGRAFPASPAGACGVRLAWIWEPQARAPQDWAGLCHVCERLLGIDSGSLSLYCKAAESLSHPGFPFGLKSQRAGNDKEEELNKQNFKTTKRSEGWKL